MSQRRTEAMSRREFLRTIGKSVLALELAKPLRFSDIFLPIIKNGGKELELLIPLYIFPDFEQKIVFGKR